MKRVAASLLCVTLAACTTAGDRRVQVVSLGSSVTLAPGEAATVKDSGTTVRFVAVSEDSRCPRDTTCIWAGEVKVQLEIRETSKAASRSELREGESTAGGHCRVTLASVEPQPVGATRIKPSDYRVTLQIAALEAAAAG